MASTTTQTTTDTLTLLEERIQRIDYALNGYPSTNTTSPSNPPTSTTSATARLRHLERTLQNLAAQHPAVTDTLSLQKKCPSAFHPPQTTTASSLPPSDLVSLVLSQADLYTKTSTHLSTAESTPLPDPASAGTLAALQPRINALATKQDKQAREVAELRARSAKAVETWYQSGVLEMGGKWAEWEDRVREAEILVRRNEAAKKREAEGLI